MHTDDEELSVSRKSASILSFSSGAKICKKAQRAMRLPTPKERPFGTQRSWAR